MLNIKLSESTTQVIKDLIVEWRRGHVSRFPVEVESLDERPDLIRFVDSRFPTNTFRRDRCLGTLERRGCDDKGRPIYLLTSRMIRNEKYATHNEAFYTKETTDPKKLLKMLRDYVRPYTALEIVDRTTGSVGHDLTMWVEKPKEEFNIMVRDLRPKDIAEELLYLQSVGVQFRSEKFQRVIAEGLGLYGEAKRRADVGYEIVHVYFQPDNSVMVSTTAGTKLTAGSWVYQTLEQAPQFVQQQVAMLRMCEQNAYIPEVGRKVNDNMYWIHVAHNDFKVENT